MNRQFERGNWVGGIHPRDGNRVEGYFLHVTMDGDARIDIRHDDRYFGSYWECPLDKLFHAEFSLEDRPHYVFAEGDYVEWLDDDDNWQEGWLFYKASHNKGWIHPVDRNETVVVPLSELMIAKVEPPPSTGRYTKPGIPGTRVASAPPLEYGDRVRWHCWNPVTEFKGTFRNWTGSNWAWIVRDDGYLVYAYGDKLHYDAPQ